MSKTIGQTEYGDDGSAGDFAAPAAISPVYADSLAAANSFRQYEWYLDGKRTVGGNANGANVDQISTEYTGSGVKVGIIDQGFDIHNIDLVGRFDLQQSYDPRDTAGATSITPDSAAEAHGTWVSGVLGASASNQTGAVGVAPDATLVGYYARLVSADRPRPNWRICWRSRSMSTSPTAAGATARRFPIISGDRRGQVSRTP